MKIKNIAIAIAIAVVAGMTAQIQAAMVMYTNRTSFDAASSSVYNSNFNDFGTGFGSPGSNFTRGDVTYNSTENLTWGSSTPYTTYSTLSETLIGNNFWSPIEADINATPNYTGFGFDIATYGGSPITINVFTNLNTYTLNSLTIANSAAGQKEFKGFVLAGEHFTGFKIIADAGSGNLPGITNVALGFATSAPVPEPASMAMWGLGALGMIFAGRRRNRRNSTIAT